MDDPMLTNDDKAKRDDKTAKPPPEKVNDGRFQKGCAPGPGRPPGKQKSYRDTIPRVAKRIVDILDEKDDSWIREMKKTHPDKLLVWSTQLLRITEQLNPTGNVAVESIGNLIASMDEETLNARLITAANLLQGNSTYFASNKELSSLVDTLRAVIETQNSTIERLEKRSEPVVVVSAPSVKTLPAPDDTDEQKQLPEPDREFERMLNLDEDDDSGVWQ